MIVGQLVLLATVRWFAVLRVQPLVRIALGPATWGAALVLAFVLALRDAGLYPALAPMSKESLVIAVVAEALLGTAIGHVLALGAHAIVGAATSTALVLRTPPAPLVALFVALVLATSLALGLHHAALQGAAALQSAWPLGDPLAWIPTAARAVPTIVATTSAAFTLALAFATPALLTAATAELVAAAVARGPGSAAALAQAVAPTLRLAMVLVALGASWAIDLPRWAAAALPG